jgi:hypothetical protein
MRRQVHSAVEARCRPIPDRQAAGFFYAHAARSSPLHLSDGPHAVGKVVPSYRTTRME